MDVFFRSSMKKARMKSVSRYSFGGLITQFLNGCGLKKYPIDYKSSQNSRVLNVSELNDPKSTFGPILTHFQRNKQDNSLQAICMVCNI